MEDWDADLSPCNFATTHLHKEAALSSWNFATTHLKAYILDFYLPLTSRPMKRVFVEAFSHRVCADLLVVWTDEVGDNNRQQLKEMVCLNSIQRLHRSWCTF